MGVHDQRAVSDADIDAYRRLALGDDGGTGYLAIMRSLRTGPAGPHYAPAIATRRVPYPVRIGWGGHDPILRLRRFAWPLLAASHLPSLTLLPGKHFLQEDLAPSVAAIVAENAARA